MRQFLRKKKGIHFEQIVLGFKDFFSKVRTRTMALFRQWSGGLRRKKFFSRMDKADIILSSTKTLGLYLTALIYRLVLRSRYVHSMPYLEGGI
jgi:hypothetical protein